MVLISALKIINICDQCLSKMKADVLFVHVVHKDCLIFESFSLVWFDFPRPWGTWEYIDLQRDCTQSRLSEGNEARPTAIFTRDVLDMRFLVCMCVTVHDVNWSFAAFWMVRHSKNWLLLCNIYFSLKYPLQPYCSVVSHVVVYFSFVKSKYPP